ncbi:hypothetical protein PoB_001255800 [Plakobranchus ocellatus]|uniref:Uncharacterized protein n=1 Tax=Plakobranchus ocellatus TaxID=259542 RepID=A0AAV3YUM6_9GAST|nr:hypothetical protein PoB_001255800 [Plakobranchus ocellatus]
MNLNYPKIFDRRCGTQCLNSITVVNLETDDAIRLESKLFCSVVISYFRALRQARTPVAGLKAATEGSLQIPVAAVGVGSTVASDSALRSAGTLMSPVRAPPSAPRPDGEP